MEIVENLVEVGDLLRVPPCPDRESCGCFFCSNKSNCIGLVIKDMDARGGMWTVLFDCGEWDIHWTDLLDAGPEIAPSTQIKIISKRQ